jgi:phospholipid/cholesterol/gamma-HCH transport system substrate-binding protein
MSKKINTYVKLGSFVIVGTAFFIVALYMIGSNRNIFGNTIRISAIFYNVNGLMPGNNVRYAGTDIGTVDDIIIENDSSVTVYLIIQKSLSKHVKNNALAGIGTNGLMGNKLVNINPGTGSAPSIKEGDVLLSLRPIENDEMIRTLNTTNQNLADITTDLKRFASKLNKDKGLLKLLEDSVSTANIMAAIAAFRAAAENTEAMTRDLNTIAEKLKNGGGLASMLINDTASANNLRSALSDIMSVADTMSVLTDNLSEFSRTLNDPNGLVYVLSTDTSLANDFRETMSNVKTSTELLNEDLKALQKSTFMKKYFKEKEKEERKGK